MTGFANYLRHQIEARWYGRPGLLRALAPVSWLYGVVAERRKQRALSRLQRSTPTHQSTSEVPLVEVPLVEVPIVVVGNIVAGGTGKTPVVMDVVERLRALGATPGVVSRGYGGKSETWPRVVNAGSDPQLCGDEAVELATRLLCPVVVAPDRSAAARWLVDYFGCNVIVSDDGLQHYSLARSLEIAVVDAVRGQGNGRLLPSGPLREPAARLASVDCIVKTSRALESKTEGKIENTSGSDGASSGTEPLLVPELLAELRPVSATHLHSAVTVELAQAPFVGEHCVALSAIGNPGRFHDDLGALGCTLTTRVLADHSGYVNFVPDWPSHALVVTTAKDAVKLLRSAVDTDWLESVWVLNRDVVLSSRQSQVLDELLTTVISTGVQAAVENLEKTNNVLPKEKADE